MSMTTFGSRLSTCNRVLQKERLLTYGVISPGQSRGISPLQGGGGRRSEGRRGASPSEGFKGASRGLEGGFTLKGASRGLEGT